jgi:hypothetical protein
VTRLLSVHALDRVLNRLDTSLELLAVGVTSGIDLAVEPNGVFGTGGRTASLEAVGVVGTRERPDEVVVLGEGEALALAVAGGLLGSGGVAEDALAHTRDISVEDLDGVGGVESKLGGCVELEYSVVLGLRAACSVLVLGADDHSALGSLNREAVEVGSRSVGDELGGSESGGLGVGSSASLERAGGGKRSDAGGKGGSGELHVDGCWWWWLVIRLSDWIGCLGLSVVCVCCVQLSELDDGDIYTQKPHLLTLVMVPVGMQRHRGSMWSVCLACFLNVTA